MLYYYRLDKKRILFLYNTRAVVSSSVRLRYEIAMDHHEAQTVQVDSSDHFHRSGGYRSGHS